MLKKERVYVFPGAEEITRANRRRKIRKTIDLVAPASIIAVGAYLYHSKI